MLEYPFEFVGKLNGLIPSVKQDLNKNAEVLLAELIVLLLKYGYNSNVIFKKDLNKYITRERVAKNRKAWIIFTRLLCTLTLARFILLAIYGENASFRYDLFDYLQDVANRKLIRLLLVSAIVNCLAVIAVINYPEFNNKWPGFKHLFDISTYPKYL